MSAAARSTRRSTRWGALLGLLAVACSGGGVATTSSSGQAPVDAPSTAASAATGTTAATGPHEDCRPFGGSEAVASSAIDDDARFPWEREDPVVLPGFDADAIIPGGPPPDGIAPIEEPCFESQAAGDEWLEPVSPVLVIEVDGDARAYPLAIMTQHEIANDVIAGRPVVVTYCPLCNSGLAFDRRVGDRVLDFGTSGRLFQSNLVMYDRQTKTLWSQFTGEAVVGADFVGTTLDRIPTGLLSWAEFKDAYPRGTVLSRETGHARSYGRNPYPGYEGAGSRFLFRGPTDDRLPPDTRVVGVTDREEEAATAITLDRLRADRVVDVEVGGEPVTVWWAPGAASALDRASVDAGRDVGQTGAFVPLGPDGQRLRFAPAPDDDSLFVDDATGSRWDLSGRAVDGPLEGGRLEPVSRDDTFWFVWFAFRPSTTVTGAEAVSG